MDHGSVPMLPIQRTDYHSEISNSVVRGDVAGFNLHGAQQPLVMASNLCKVDPHDACFNSLFHFSSILLFPFICGFLNSLVFFV